MNPMTLATAVADGIRPVLGRPAEPVTLYQMVRARLSEDTYHATVLRGAEEQPDNDCRVQSLAGALAEAIAADPGYGTQLATLLAETDPARYLLVISQNRDFTRRDDQLTGRAQVVRARRSPE